MPTAKRKQTSSSRPWRTYLLIGLVAGLFALPMLLGGAYMLFNTPIGHQLINTVRGLKPVSIPEGFEVHGIDVSHHQGEIDWHVLANQKDVELLFAFVRSSEGASRKDRRFAENWKQARAEGMIRGAYHFYRPNRDARTQAELFIGLVELLPGDLPPVLDIETTDGVKGKKLREGLRTWLKAVEAHYGVRPILYTNPSFYKDHLQGYFEDYPLWIAQYDIRLPMVDRKWQFWQHTDLGRLKGVSEKIDLNVFAGSEEELEALCLPQ